VIPNLSNARSCERADRQGEFLNWALQATVEESKRQTNKNMNSKIKPWAVCFASALLTLGLTACSTTKQTRSVEPSGFLTNYEQLREGKGEESLLLYMNPSASWSQYNKIMLDPIEVWYGGDHKMDKVPKDELQGLVDYLNLAIRNQLAGDYTFVTEPGPDVLRLRVAITDAKKSRVVADVVSTIVPQVRTLSGLKRLTTGTHAFVGRAAVEAEILDSASGERLWAGVDERAGGKSVRGMFSRWNDVEEACNYWAERLKTRLAEERAK
jgi:hypothetical protein